MALISVVFPAPFGPMIARISPASTPRLTSSRALMPPKFLLTRSMIKTRIGPVASVTTAPLGPFTSQSMVAYGPPMVVMRGCARPSYSLALCYQLLPDCQSYWLDFADRSRMWLPSRTLASQGESQGAGLRRAWSSSAPHPCPLSHGGEGNEA